jgi:predicted nucleic acid-binding protein
MPDEEDRKFYNVAKSSGAFLITGNIKHFPPESFIVTPADFLKVQMGPTQPGR